MIAVPITADTAARDAELLRQRYAFMTLCAAISTDTWRDGFFISIERHQDVVDAVTVGADRSAAYASSQSLPVNALHELVGFGSMALATGVGNVHFRNRRFLIRSRFDVVAIVTVGANCRAQVAAGDGFRVHALSIRKQWPIANATSLHDGLIAMTAAASLGNIRAIDR